MVAFIAKFFMKVELNNRLVGENSPVFRANLLQHLSRCNRKIGIEK